MLWQYAQAILTLHPGALNGGGVAWQEATGGLARSIATTTATIYSVMRYRFIAALLLPGIPRHA